MHIKINFEVREFQAEKDDCNFPKGKNKQEGCIKKFSFRLDFHDEVFYDHLK